MKNFSLTSALIMTTTATVVTILIAAPMLVQPSPAMALPRADREIDGGGNKQNVEASGQPASRKPLTQGLIRQEIKFTDVPRKGGGDADVNSKKGRQTDVSVKTSNLVNHGNHLTIDVTYTIRERAKNYTHLERSETVTLPAPSGSCIVTFGTNKINANYYNPFFGEDHNWYNISNAKNINNSYFEALSIRFDGKGNDDTGNAQLDGTIAIPVKLKKCG